MSSEEPRSCDFVIPVNPIEDNSVAPNSEFPIDPQVQDFRRFFCPLYLLNCYREEHFWLSACCKHFYLDVYEQDYQEEYLTIFLVRSSNTNLVEKKFYWASSIECPQFNGLWEADKVKEDWDTVLHLRDPLPFPKETFDHVSLLLRWVCPDCFQAQFQS